MLFVKAGPYKPLLNFSLTNPQGEPVAQMTIADLQRYQDTPRGSELTLRMLMQHSHGLPDLTCDTTAIGTPPLVQQIILQLLGHTDADAALPEQWTGTLLLENYLASRLPVNALFPPGAGYHYGDTGPLLTSLIVERVTGMSLAQAYRTRIFDPLAMNDTYLHHYEPARQPR